MPALAPHKEPPPRRLPLFAGPHAGRYVVVHDGPAPAELYAAASAGSDAAGWCTFPTGSYLDRYVLYRGEYHYAPSPWSVPFVDGPAAGRNADFLPSETPPPAVRLSMSGPLLIFSHDPDSPDLPHRYRLHAPDGPHVSQGVYVYDPPAGPPARLTAAAEGYGVPTAGGDADAERSEIGLALIAGGLLIFLAWLAILFCWPRG